MVPFAVRPVPEQVCHTHNRFIFLLFNPVFCFVVNCNSLLYPSHILRLTVFWDQSEQQAVTVSKKTRNQTAGEMSLSGDERRPTKVKVETEETGERSIGPGSIWSLLSSSL